LICCLAGILGGMLGIGGGIILAPLMLEMCINPQTTSSTSNFILIINSSTGLVLFILSVRKNLFMIFILKFSILLIRIFLYLFNNKGKFYLWLFSCFWPLLLFIYILWREYIEWIYQKNKEKFLANFLFIFCYGFLIDFASYKWIFKS